MGMGVIFYENLQVEEGLLFGDGEQLVLLSIARDIVEVEKTNFIGKNVLLIDVR